MSILDRLKGFVVYLFCQHQWVTIWQGRYNVLRSDKTIEGQVNLTFLQCIKCKDERLYASDRTYLLTEENKRRE